MTRPNITPWPSFAPQGFQPTEAQKQAIAAVPALLEALEKAATATTLQPSKRTEQLRGIRALARSALIAAGYQF